MPRRDWGLDTYQECSLRTKGKTLPSRNNLEFILPPPVGQETPCCGTGRTPAHLVSKFLRDEKHVLAHPCHKPYLTRAVSDRDQLPMRETQSEAHESRHERADFDFFVFGVCKTQSNIVWASGRAFKIRMSPFTRGRFVALPLPSPLETARFLSPPSQLQTSLLSPRPCRAKIVSSFSAE